MLIPFLVLLFKILPMVSSLNNLRVLIESNKPFITRVDEFLKDESGSINDGNSSFVFDRNLLNLKMYLLFFFFNDKKVIR